MGDNQVQILQCIANYGIPAGATYLSQQLSIPPATIGRGLAELEKQGFVKKISNKGRIITDEGIRFLEQIEENRLKVQNADKLVRLAENCDKETLIEILKVRRLLEPYAASQASLNGTEEEFDELEGLMIEHLHAIRQGESGSKIDLSIHLQIARMSRNRTIYQILKIILTGDNASEKFSFVSEHGKHTQIKQHDTLIQAIRSHSPDKAASAMETHLDQILEDVEKYSQQDKESSDD